MRCSDFNSQMRQEEKRWFGLWWKSEEREQYFQSETWLLFFKKAEKSEKVRKQVSTLAAQFTPPFFLTGETDAGRWSGVGWECFQRELSMHLSSAFRKHLHILPLCSPSQVRWNFRTPTRTCPMSSSTTRRRPACLCCSRASMETCPSPRGC